MKKLLIFAMLVMVCTCCSNKPSVDVGQRTLYITSSVGAFNGEETTELLPSEAYATIKYLSDNSVSLYVYYEWSASDIIIFDIPVIAINGTNNDFTISQEGVSAKYSMSKVNITGQDITVNISGHFSKTGSRKAENVSFNLILSPSDNTKCPYVEIKEISLTPVDLEMGGDIAEWYAARIRFNNHLAFQIKIESLGSRKKVLAGESKLFYDNYGECDNLSSLTTVLTIEEKEYEVYFFAEGGYGEEKHIVYHFVGGWLDVHRYTEYTIDITPSFYESLKGKELSIN